MDYSHVHTIFLQRIADVRKKENQTFFLFGFFLFLLAAIGSFALVSLLEAFFHFGTIIRGILFFASMSFSLGIAIKFFFPPLFRIFNITKNKNEEILAEQIGSFFPQIKDKLHNALQLILERKHTAALYSPALIDASLNDLYNEVQSVNFLLCIDSSKLKKIRKQFFLSLALVFALLLFSPTSFLSAFSRVIHFQQTYDAPPLFVFRIEPGNIEIVRGESIPITISIEQREISFPNLERKTLTLFKRLQGQVHYEPHILKANAKGMFTTEFSVVKTPTFYFAEFQDVRSDEYAVSIVDKPLIRSFRIHVAPPRYTKLSSKELEENVGDVAAYKGTTLSFALTSSKALNDATLVFSDSSSLSFKVQGTTAGISFPLLATKNYHLRIEDVDKLFNDNPIEYRITMIPDEIPAAAIIVPGKNLDADESMQLDMQFRLNDDFGLTKLQLAHKLVHSKYSAPEENFHFVPIPLTSSLKQLELPYRWNFTKLHLAPEDVLMYYLEVFDNDNVSGPKSGKSLSYVLRLPSLDEVFAEAEQKQNETLESLTSASQQAQHVRKELEKLQQELKKRPDKVDWLQKKKAEELAKKYDDVKQKVATAAQQMEQMMQQAEQHQLLSPQTMQKYEELQKMMKELDSPEFRELLKKLQQQQQPLSPEQMKEAMKNFSMNEEMFRKALERMLELLKRLAMEQKLDELIQRTEEAIQQQKNLKKETQTSSKETMNELAKQQSDLEKQTDKLEQEANELAKQMNELADEMPAEKLEQANEQFGKSNPQQQMNNAHRQMKSGQKQQAQQSQQQAQQSLEEFLSELQQAQKEMRSKQQQQIIREMQKQLENVLEVSKHQEQLKNETQQLEYNSPRFRENAQQQHTMSNDVQNIANAFSELGKKSFSISPEMGKTLGDAMKQMEAAMSRMEARNAQSSSQQQNAAMGSLNRVAAMMQKSLQGMQGGGGMGMQGMMQAMGQMASQQQGINEGMQGAMGQGNGMSMEQAAAMSKLAQQQSGLQKSLQELAGEAKHSDEMSRLLGDLDAIAKEMQEVVRDMEQGNVNPETLRKQDRILSRLLDSQRSLRERDYEKRRRAEQSTISARPSPMELDVDSREGKNQLQQDLLKALNEKYTKDFESLIRKYFEELQKQESKPQ